MEQCTQVLKKAFIFSRWIQCHAYEWDGHKKEIRVVPRSRIIAWALNAYMAAAYAAFVHVRCIQVNISEEASVLQKIYMEFMAIFYSCAAWLQFCTAIKMDDVGNAVEPHLNFLQRLEGNLFCQKSFSF